MANRFNIVGNIYSSSQLPDLDFKYGPFSSTEEAFEFLGPDEEDIACVGLTVGIQEDPDGPIVEYWFKDACESADDLVPKGAEVPSGTVIDPDYVHTDNNYTDEEKTKLDGLENYDDTEILAALDDKVDKEDGKVLSSNDFTTAEKTKLASVEENAQENIIEEVKVNNTALTPDENKSINISVPEVLEDLDNINVTSATDGQVLAYDATNDEWVNETIVVDKALDDLTDVTVTSASDRQTLIYDDTNDEWVNGTLNTSDLTNDSGFIDNTVDDLVNYYDKTEIDSKVASVYKYKGSVNTYADLPSTDQVVGDVYNIATADKTHHIKAGDNVAWNGTEWDVLAGEIDLSDYYTSSEVDDLLDEKINEPATEGTDGQVLTTDGNGGRTWTTVDVDKDLGDLGDVTITDPTDGQILKYDATNEEWVNGESVGVSSLEDLTDTSITSLANGQTLIYDYTTSKWVNKLSEAENVVYKKIPGSEWSTKTWTGLTEFYGLNIWSDDNNIYYSNGNDHYVLDKETSTWSTKIWTGLTEFYGLNIWSDNNNIYYSNNNDQYILDKETSTWSTKTWTGLTKFIGRDIWSDGNNIYYSNGNDHYVLDKETSTWSTKTWTGLTEFIGRCIWSDDNNIYYSNGPLQYTLDKRTSTWSTKTWTGLTGFSRDYIWSDGNNIYNSNGNDQYILDKETSTWSIKTWSGLTEFIGCDIWSDGNNIYYSYNNDQYILDLVNINVKEAIDNIDTKIINVFTGTQAEWDVLTTEQKTSYQFVAFTDDESGAPTDISSRISFNSGYTFTNRQSLLKDGVVYLDGTITLATPVQVVNGSIGTHQFDLTKNISLVCFVYGDGYLCGTGTITFSTAKNINLVAYFNASPTGQLVKSVSFSGSFILV